MDNFVSHSSKDAEERLAAYIQRDEGDIIHLNIAMLVKDTIAMTIMLRRGRDDLHKLIDDYWDNIVAVEECKPRMN